MAQNSGIIGDPHLHIRVPTCTLYLIVMFYITLPLVNIDDYLK